MGHLDRRGGFISYLKMDITWLSLILGVITLATPALSGEPRVVCYYTNWSVYRPGTARFNPQNINPYLCTHLVYAFGGFTKDNTLKPFDKYQDIEKGGYAKFTGLKTYNKNLKTMLAIGGWNEGSTRFSPMVASKERRKEFVRNAIKFLRQNRFDGLDLDWEYPAFRDGGKPKDRENYAKLVKELREEFEREAEKTGKPRLLLTMAVPAGIEYIEKGFDVKTLNRYLDWMNLLTYDYHSAFEPAVNHHAPLYPLEEPNEYSVDTELNIDYTIKFYLENGADPDKLVLGIPTYGRSYTLFNADAVEIGSPADGPGDQGDATREKGYLAYYEICESLKPKTKKRSASDEDSEEYEEEDEEWTIMHPNPAAMGPVAFKGNQWVGYDDIDIVKKKGEYVAENGLGGIMFWSIDNDDFRGNCHEKPYPLIEAAKEAYIGKLGSTDNTIATRTSKPVNRPTSNRRRNRPKSSSTTEKPSTTKSNKRKSSVSSTTPSWNVTPEPPTTPDPGSDFKCVDEGFYPHPRDCKKYFWCLDSGPSDLGIVAHQFTCPSGLFFNKAADSCDFARNVLCKMPAATTKAPTTKSSTTVTTTTTTTRKPVRLSTKSSVLFRTSSTATPEPESEEYEDENTGDITDEDAEDPRVIKELIDLIKKVGGVEQLEKQLHLAESSASTDGASTTTPNPFNKKLYQKVLERARVKNKFPSNSIIQTSQNSRRGPQSQGLEPATDKDRLLKKDRPQYTTINRQRGVASTPEPDSSEDDEEESEETAAVQQSRARAVESQQRESQARDQSRGGTTSKPLQYVNIRRARPTTTSDTADDTASRNALFERTATYGSVSESNSLDVQSSRKENVPEYVTIRRQRPTTEETTTVQYQEPEVEQETALEREISSQPQYTSIVRTRGTTVSVSEEPSTSEPPFIRPRYTTLAPPEDPSTPEPTTVLAVQISSLLNSPSSEEAETTVVLTTEAEPTTTSTTSRPTTTTTTTTAAPPSSSTRRTVLRRRGSTTPTTTTPLPLTSTTQAGKRTFLRRTKPTSPPDTSDEATTLPTTIDNDTKFPKRGGSKFKSKESARNETSAGNRRPSLSTGARRSERPPTRNFVRRRPGGANVAVNTTTAAPSASSTAATAAVTRRPFRIASRRRPAGSTTTTSTSTTTTAPTTLALESEESLQDIGDTDAIEDPSLEPRASKKAPKTPRRPLVNLKEDPKDQNPSATNEDERKRQSKKYSSSFKQIQLDELLKAKSGEITTETGSTPEDYNAETVLAFATHQLITAPLPIITDYDEGTKPTRTKTTQAFKETGAEYTNTPTYNEYSTAAYRTYPTSQGFVETTIGDAYSIYNTPRITTVYEEPKTTEFTANSRPYTATYEPKTNYDVQKTTEDITTTDSRLNTQDIQDIEAGKVTTLITDTFPSTVGRQAGYTNIPTSYKSRISTTTFEVPKQTETISRYPTTPVYQAVTNQYVPTTRDYVDTPERFLSFSTPNPPKPRGFSSPNVITPGYSGLQRGGTKYLTLSEKSVTTPAADIAYSTPGYKSSSQDPAYFTREYLLESPVTKTYDDEYQYLSPTTPQTNTRKVFRKKIQRRISTTLRPTSTTAPYVAEVTTTPRPARVPSRKPFEKVPKVEPNRTYRPVANYDYYDDSAEKMALKYSEDTKVILHGKGSIECLDVGNFPHPSSCKKFISCARMEFGALLGWEYICPKGLSFDPVGGICNWSAGLGCDEKDF